MKKRKSCQNYWLYGACAVVLLYGGIGPGFAQAKPTESNGPIAKGDAASGAIEEVVVTAERRKSNVQSTPLMIQAISGADLSARGVTSVSGLQMLAPNLHVVATGNNPSTFIRGVGSIVSDQRGDSATSFSIDGVPIVRPLSVNAAFFDVKRIEILEGPQGTLYGRNATVGAINIISSKPTLGQFDGSIGLTAGNYDLYQADGVVNLPISNTVAVRAALQTQKHDGYLSSGAEDADNVAARLSALWQPNDVLSVLLRGMYYRDTGVGVGDVPLKSASGSFLRPSNPWYVATGVVNNNDTVGPDGHQRLSSVALSGQIDLNLGAVKATIVPGYVTTTYSALAYDGGFRKRYDTPDEQESIEARLASQGDTRLSWVAGLFYLHDHQSGVSDFGFSTLDYSRTDFGKLDLSSYAAFGQTTYAITPDFHVVGGLRYTHDEKQMNGVLSTVSLNLTPIAPGPAIYGKLTYNNVSYKVGFAYDIAPDHLLYANVATGYKAGGFNASTPPNTYKPEYMTAYIIGSKNMFLQHRIVMNVEAWYLGLQGCR